MEYHSQKGHKYAATHTKNTATAEAPKTKRATTKLY